MDVNQQQVISFNPDTFVRGGMLDDADVTINTLRLVEWDYNGNVDVPCLALHLNAVDSEGNEHDEYLSAGDIKRLKPSEDGKKAISVGGATGLNMNSNAGIFLTSLINGGFPKDRVSNDLSVFDGTLVHVRRIAQAQRAGFQPTRKEGREATVLTVEKVISLPGEQKTGKGKGKGAASSKTAPATAAGSATAPVADSDLDAKTVTAVAGILATNNGTTNKSLLPSLLFAALKDDPDKAKAVQLAFNPIWLGSGERP